MAQEMCPSCRQIRYMRIATSVKTVTGVDEKRKKIKTTSFHCEVCNQFVCSQDQEDQTL
jgi:hypothetical protein